MAFGVAMYLRALEEAGLVKVRRISGCSAGAMVALMYLTDIYYDMDPYFASLLKHYHTHRDLSKYMEIMRAIVGELLTDDLSALNGRLFITYFDTELRKQVVVSEYANREELIECLARSSHIPFMSTPVLKHGGRYIDGITPYLFDDRQRRVLFVKLVHMFNVGRFLNVRNETNTQSRILEGVTDANLFFTRGHSHMCSYVDTWRCVGFMMLRVRIVIFLFMVALVERLCFVYRFAPKVCGGVHRRTVDWFKN